MICSDNYSIQIGDKLGGSPIVKDEVYPICRFPGSNKIRRLTFSAAVVFSQNERNVVELVNENGEVVFTQDFGEDAKYGNDIVELITLNIPATENSIQTIGVRWTLTGGNFQASFGSMAFVYDASEMVSWG